jgi:redox-regulated HSP33 family molecular chaperone
MAALPQAELTEILETGPFPVITTCFNCSTAYKFPRAEIEELLSQQVDN